MVSFGIIMSRSSGACTVFSLSRFVVGAVCILVVGLPTMPTTAGVRIAFASHRDGNWEIYAMDVDGRRQTRLTTRGEQDRFPLWSPDGSKLAFGSQVGRGWELWVMAADGTNPRHLCSHISAKGSRSWSPDGR